MAFTCRARAEIVGDERADTAADVREGASGPTAAPENSEKSENTATREHVPIAIRPSASYSASAAPYRTGACRPSATTTAGEGGHNCDDSEGQDPARQSPLGNLRQCLQKKMMP